MTATAADNRFTSDSSHYLLKRSTINLGILKDHDFIGESALLDHSKGN